MDSKFVDFQLPSDMSHIAHSRLAIGPPKKIGVLNSINKLPGRHVRQNMFIFAIRLPNAQTCHESCHFETQPHCPPKACY